MLDFQQHKKQQQVFLASVSQRDGGKIAIQVATLKAAPPLPIQRSKMTSKAIYGLFVSRFAKQIQTLYAPPLKIRSIEISLVKLVAKTNTLCFYLEEKLNMSAANVFQYLEKKLGQYLISRDLIFSSMLVQIRKVFLFLKNGSSPPSPHLKGTQRY